MHAAAIYDLTAGEAEQRATNVEGTRAVIDLAKKLDATLRHLLDRGGGHLPGTYTEADFDVSPGTSYATTRPSSRPSNWSRCRGPAPPHPSAGRGGRRSRTGEMDKIDGPYSASFGPWLLGRLPRLTPIALPDVGRTNIVPVDYVVNAVGAHPRPDRDGRPST